MSIVRHVSSAMKLALLILALTVVESASAATTASLTSPNLSLSGAGANSTVAGASGVTYSFRCRTPKKIAGTNLLNGATVTIVFPNGTDASTVNTATSKFNGQAISNFQATQVNGSTTPNQVVFTTNVAVRVNKNVTIALTNMTNATSSGAKTATLSVVNASTGNDKATFKYTLIGGPADHIKFMQQPTDTQNHSAIFPPITVAVVDVNDNPTSATNSISMAIGTNPAGGKLFLNGNFISPPGPTVVAINGTATFSGLSIDNSSTSKYTLVATTTGLPGVNGNTATSAQFLINPGNVPSLNFIGTIGTTPADQVLKSTAFGVQLQILDTTGHLVTNLATPITASIIGQSGVLLGTQTRTPASTGIVTFDDLKIDVANTPSNPFYTIHFAASGNNPTQTDSNAFVITPLTVPDHIAFTIQPSESTAGDFNFDSNSDALADFAVGVVDQFGNVVTSAPSTQITITANPIVPANPSATFTLSLNGATATAPVVLNTTAGVALFSADAGTATYINEAGSYTLTAQTNIFVNPAKNVATSNSPPPGVPDFPFIPTPPAGTFIVDPAAAITLVVALVPSGAQKVDSPAEIDVTAYDEFGNQDYNYAGFVAFGLTGTATAQFSPANYQFTTAEDTQGDNGFHKFLAGVSFMTPNTANPTADVSVTATDTDGISGATTPLFNVNKGDTTITVSTPFAFATAGNPVTLTATLSAHFDYITGGGSVTFLIDGVTSVPATTYTGNKATVSQTFALGDHTITATYTGNSNYNPASTTTTYTLHVVAGSSSVAVQPATPNPSVFGQPVILSANVTPSDVTNPTGSVSFYDGSILSTALGTGTVTPLGLTTNGNASITISTLSVIGSPHTILATYSGDPNYGGSVDNTGVSVAVNKADTTVSIVTISPLTFSTGPQNVTLNANVKAVLPSLATPNEGTVTFTVTDPNSNVTTITPNVNNGAAQAIFQVLPSTDPGHFTVDAVYTLTSNFNASSHASGSFDVVKANSSTTLALSPSTAIVGNSVVFTATVDSSPTGNGTPTGTVTFKVDGTAVGAPVTLDSFGQATLTTSFSQIGTHTVQAFYNGDNDYIISNSSSLIETIDGGPPATLAFTVQPSNANTNAKITPAVQVSVKDAFGNAVPSSTLSITVSMFNDPSGGSLAGAPPTNAIAGVATFGNLSINLPGTGYTVIATGSGVSSAISAPFNIIAVVNNTPPNFTSPAAANPSTANVGQTVQFTAVATGQTSLNYSWDFGDGSTPAATISGSTSHVYSAPGTYTMTVTVKDGNNLSATSSVTVTVVAAGTPGPGPTPTPSGDICTGLTPQQLSVQQVAAKFFFPSTSNKDSLSLKATLQLPSGFAPANTVLQYQIGGLTSLVTLDGKGNGPKSKTVRCSLKFKAPKKGTTFTGGTGKLSLQLRSQNLSQLVLNGVTTLNAATPKTGTPATIDVCIVLGSTNAYEMLGLSGLYKARVNKNAQFSAKSH